MGEFSLLVRQELPLSVRPPEPQPARKPPASTAVPDNTGFAVFTAGGGQVLTLNLSLSESFSRSKQQEKERLVDVVRVKQKTKDPVTGKEEINEENYIDVKVPKEINMTDSNGVETIYKYAEEPFVSDVGTRNDNVEILNYDVREENKSYIDEDITDPDTVGRVAPLVKTVKINRRPIRRRR